MMRTTLSIAAIVVSCAAGAAVAQAQPAGDYYFDRSDAASVQVLGNVEKFHIPGCAEGIKTRRYEAALADCEFILGYFPNHPKALLLVADLCAAWKSARCDPDPYFAAAIAANPRISATYSTKGVYLLRANRVGEAIEALKQAAVLDPNSLNAQYNLGLAYLEAKQYELANTHAQRAYRLGAPVPGLRDRLRKAGYWKPEQAAPAAPAPKSPGGAGK